MRAGSTDAAAPEHYSQGAVAIEPAPAAARSPRR